MLSQSQINNIEAKVSTVLEDVYGSIEKVTIPIELNTILSHFHITLKNGEFEDKTVSGAFVRKEPAIYIATDEPGNRKTFTVAHEFGHYILHSGKDHEVFYRSQILALTDEKKQEEQEANWFAASLLMPEKQLRHYYSLTQELGELAVIFTVSSIAVYYRLKNLGFTV